MLVKTLYYAFTTEREFCTHLINLGDFELLPVHRVFILEQNMFGVIFNMESSQIFFFVTGKSEKSKVFINESVSRRENTNAL